jgi:hypothetical protein
MALETVVIGAPNTPENQSLYEKISPDWYLKGREAPPVPWYGLIGTLDRLVDPEEAKTMYGRFKKVTDPPHVFHVLEGAHHGFILFPSVRVRAASDGVLFLLDHLVTQKEATGMMKPLGDTGDLASRLLDTTPTADSEAGGGRPCC